MSTTPAKAIQISGEKYTVIGKVVNKTGKGIAGLTVHAADQDLIGKHDHLGAAITDTQGQFTINFTAADFQDFISERHPDIYFRVYHKKKVLLDTEYDCIKDAEERTEPIVLEVDMEETAPIPDSPEEATPVVPVAISWEKVDDVAQYKGASWENEVMRAADMTLDEAIAEAEANPDISYFIYINSPMFLEGKEGPGGWTEKGQFRRRDVIFFSGKPHYGSAPQADAYEKRKIVWKKKTNVAQYGGADWKNEIMRLSGISLETAKQVAEKNPAITYFFHMRETMWLTGKSGPGGWTEKGHFHPGDAVFFTGKPWYGSAPQADAYEKQVAPLWVNAEG